MINFSYQQDHYAGIILEPEIKLWLRYVISSENKKEGEIQYVFCDDEYLLTINQDFLNHDTYTDIISFPSSEITSIISGEIYISIERVLENSKMIIGIFIDELHRVIVHGVLHFIGYDDHTTEEKLEMRNKEDYYLNLRS